MTDQRARAERLLTDLIQLVATDGGYFNDTEKARAVAMAALADERQLVLDEIGDQLDQLGDWYFDEGNTQARLAVEKVERFLNEYAKAHAGQEG